MKHNKRNWQGGGSMSDGYVLAYAPYHPHANGPYVPEHRLVVERAMGKTLRLDAPVHHVNGDKADNRPANLVACDSNAYHQLLHRRQRAHDACGNANFRLCFYCRKYSDPTDMVRASGTMMHRKCRRLYMALIEGGADRLARTVEHMSATPPEIDVTGTCPTCNGSGRVMAGPHPPSTKQIKILTAIEDLTRETGTSPILSEIAERCGLKSIGTVAEHVATLQAKGYVFRDPHMQRSIRIIREWRLAA